MSKEVKTSLKKIFGRCVQCPDVVPACPKTCKDNEICSQIPSSCDECARTECVAVGAKGASGGSGGGGGGGANPGVIAGGVIGGVVVIGLIVFLVWKYCMKGKRRQSEQFGWDEPVEETEEKGPAEFTMQRDARASTHTVASLASTVLTRASNIIQIAYIPGVTNRGGPNSPDLLVPPVPPIPAAVSPGTPQDHIYSPSPTTHYFFADEGRDSTYSAMDNRQSGYARSSGVPSVARGSVASTVYRSNAVVGPQAQTIVRGKAAMVSVKSGGSGEMSPNDLMDSSTPPVPAIPVGIQLSEHHIPPSAANRTNASDKFGEAYEKYNGGTAVGTARVGKPVPLTITKKPSGSSLAGPSTVASPNSVNSDAATNYTAATNPRIHAALAAASSTRPLADTGTSTPTTVKSPTPQLRLFPSTPTSTSAFDKTPVAEDDSSPFADARTGDSPKKAQTGGLRGVIEEAFRKGSNTDARPGQKQTGRSASPFGDEHELQEDRNRSR